MLVVGVVHFSYKARHDDVVDYDDVYVFWHHDSEINVVKPNSNNNNGHQHQKQQTVAINI